MTPEHGFVSASTRGTGKAGRGPGATITFACVEGFRIAGELISVSRTCGSDRKWSGAEPSCERFVPNPTPAPKQDCTVSDWSKWAACKLTVFDNRANEHECGTGVKVRTRKVMLPARAGGKHCPALSQTKPCSVKCAWINGISPQWAGNLPEAPVELPVGKDGVRHVSFGGYSGKRAPCGAGSYRMRGSAGECTTCPYNEVAPKAGQKECTPCATGTVANQERKLAPQQNRFASFNVCNRMLT